MCLTNFLQIYLKKNLLNLLCDSTYQTLFLCRKGYVLTRCDMTLNPDIFFIQWWNKIEPKSLPWIFKLVQSTMYHLLLGLQSQVLQYPSKVSWHSNLETRDSILASRSSTALRFEMWGSSLETRGLSLEFWWLRIKKQGFYMKLFLFSKRTMLYSHVASQILTCAVFCNCLNCQPRQAFNKCKLIFSVSKISLPCTVYVPFAHHVPIFSQIVMFANKIKQKKIKITSDKKK